MDVKLSENLRSLRKSRGLTQEQLAEALSVSLGVISKWELGLSTPDLGIILELADFFETSVDVLLGYQARNRKRERILGELDALSRDRSSVVDFSRVEQTLLKYPNDFQIVLSCAELYALKGLEPLDEQKNLRALELYAKAIELLDQNQDPRIDRVSLEIARGEILLTLHRDKEAVEVLKANNPRGVNNAQIGRILADDSQSQEEAMEYLSRALLESLGTQFHVAQGLMNAYEKQGRMGKVVEVSQWMLGVIDGVRLADRVTYLDVLRVTFLSCQACGLALQGHRVAAAQALREARALAARFDASPCYTMSQIRFVTLEAATAYDSLGGSAMDAISRLVAGQNHEGLTRLWNEICAE